MYSIYDSVYGEVLSDILDGKSHRGRHDERIKKTQGVAELFKNDWYFLREQLGEKAKKTISDVGGLKVGVDGFTIILPNGNGEGVMRYAVVEKDEINTSAFKFFTTIKGKNINIYGCDCGNEIEETISGWFCVYYSSGFVVLEHWGDV